MKNLQAIKPIFELSYPGRRGTRLPVCDVPEVSISAIPKALVAEKTPDLPEVTEPDVVRHFVNLSQYNMSVDTHFYPLGSCTMKHNPKRHEKFAKKGGIGDLHPYLPEESIQGMLQMLYEMQNFLAEIAGLPGVSLQPAAGAQGEFAALLTASAYFKARGEKRTKVLFPNSAHGTNPASAALAGFQCVQLNKSVKGLVDLEELKSLVDEHTAVFMITNPNTLGLFEENIEQIAKIIHDAGGLVYIDGANMNAILGKTRPGDFGGDMMHYNVHKTFTGPHGGGGPGSGPIAVRDFLAPFLPGPIVTKSEKDGQTTYHLSTPEHSIGRVRSFFGNLGILMRGYFYLRTLGPDGVREVSEQAVLNANYIKAKVSKFLPVPHGKHCMHEFVASASELKKRGISAMDVAKRLLDYGFHAPTVYFPLVVPEALMIEPTETESKETMDAFITALETICGEEPAFLKQAPHSTTVSRPDEVSAARTPVTQYCSPCGT